MRPALLTCALAALGTLLPAAVRAQPAEPPAGYVWSAACKECHQAVYDAWEKTKHARALNRLSSADQEKECIRCHVTGAKTLVRVDDKPVNAGIQCESCHGPGAQHIADARAGTPTPLTRTPGPAMCEECHSTASPHYRGFIYGAMSKLVHKTR